MNAEEPPPQHHLSKMADDPDDDEDGQPHYSNQPYPPTYPSSSPPPGPDHHSYPPPIPHLHHHPSPRPPLPQNMTPPPPHHTLPPHHTPPPPQKRRSPTPPPPLSGPQASPHPPPTPHSHKPRAPPPPASPPPPPLQKPRHSSTPYTEYNDDDDNYDKNSNSNLRRQLCVVIFILLVLIGLAALILWLIYRPHKPTFTATAAAVYSINVTSPPFISASVQFTILTKNPNKRTTLYYDSLTVSVYYRNQAITPPVMLPPLVHRTRSAVMMSPAVGGTPVMVAGDVVEGLVGDEAYGVVGLSWVLVGRVRYKAGGWFRSGHGRVFVRCDVLVGLRQGTPGILNGGVFSNPSGQVPMLGTPPCLVDM